MTGTVLLLLDKDMSNERPKTVLRDRTCFMTGTVLLLIKRNIKEK